VPSAMIGADRLAKRRQIAGGNCCLRERSQTTA
jgi:hypothetical protein